MRHSWSYGRSVVNRCHSCDVEFAIPFTSAPIDYYEREYRDFAAPAYEDIHTGYQFLIRQIRSVAEEHLAPGAKVLDVGCGAGYLLVDLHRRGFDCLGVDFNSALVQIATERFGVPAIVQDVRTLSTLGRSFELAILSNLLEHVSEPRELLASVVNVMKPGATLVLEVPNRDWFSVSWSLQRGTCPAGDYPPHHISFWSTKALRAAAIRAGLAVVSCEPRPFDDSGRIERFVRDRLRVPSGPLASAVRAVLRTAGKIARLQGSTLNLIARKPVDASSNLQDDAVNRIV